jgi:hypothetical protein
MMLPGFLPGAVKNSLKSSERKRGLGFPQFNERIRARRAA